jgi:uncharacterized protein (TIGR02117 family)
VAAPPTGALSGRLLRAGRALLGWPALVIGLYMLAGWAGSAVPRNAGWSEAADGVEIMIETNGVHTAIVMPLVTAQKDWRADFPAEDVAAPDRPYTHVALSWGEREVFLETPTWADLSPVTVLRIIGIGGEGVLHAAHYIRPAPDPAIRPLRLSTDDYARLVRRLEREIPPLADRARYPGYEDYDVFYDGMGRYTPVLTCNQWISNMLADAGIRAGWWTPFAGGVMRWVPALREAPTPRP